jgi:DNA-binding NtrC family response regulator
MKRILVVDDEPNVRLNYRITLDVEGYEVKEASDAKEAIQLLHDQLFDLAILDLRMPGIDGLELLRLIREEGVPTPAVIITAYSDVPNAVRAMKLGAIDFLQKPLRP